MQDRVRAEKKGCDRFRPRNPSRRRFFIRRTLFEVCLGLLNALRMRNVVWQLQLAGIRLDSEMAYKRKLLKRSTVFSRAALLLVLLVMPRVDRSYLTSETGRSVILDPGVRVPLCFSAQSSGRSLPDPGLFLSIFTSQELAETIFDLFYCFVLSVGLLGMLKYLLKCTM